MNENLRKIIDSSTFTVHSGEWLYAKVSEVPSLDNCFMVAKDNDEITAVFEREKRSNLKIIEENKDLRRLIELKVSVPFYAAGFLATVTGAISAKGCNNLVISTYSKDYVMVTLEHLEKAKEALLELGFKEDD